MKSAIDRRQFGIGGVAAGAAIAAGALPASSGAFAQAAPLKLRVGWVVVPASTAPLVLEKKELLKHFGKSYVAEATRFGRGRRRRREARQRQWRRRQARVCRIDDDR